MGTPLLKTLSAGLTCALALIGCQTVTNTAETPALLVNSKRTAPKALKSAVKEALGRDVMLGYDSLTSESTLIVETGSNDPRMMGDRRLPKVDYFDLMMSGNSCYIVHRGSGEKYMLKGVNCRAITA